MNEEIEYAEMLEIPVSTVNLVKKRRRKKKEEPLSDSVVQTVNDRLEEETLPPVEPTIEEGGALRMDAAEEEKIDTVRLYSTNDTPDPYPYDFNLNEGGTYATKPLPSKKVRLALGIEFGVACALCGAIFLTNVFMQGSAINTFFRAMNTPTEVATVKPYTEFVLSPVVSELSDAKLTLSEHGVLTFQDECCVYPSANGRVSEVIRQDNGLYTLKISHTDAFTGVIEGLDVVYYSVGEEVKANVPVGFSKGEEVVQVTMYNDGELLNCFELTEENCLAWISTAE